MANPNLNIQKAVRVLIDAHFTTDAEAAKKHGISRRTVINYRNRLAEDKGFSQAFTAELEKVRQSDEWDWLSDGLRSTVRAGIRLAERANEVPAPLIPDAVTAVATWLRELGAYEQTKRIIDAEIEAAKQPADAAPPTQPRPAFGQPNATA